MKISIFVYINRNSIIMHTLSSQLFTTASNYHQFLTIHRCNHHQHDQVYARYTVLSFCFRRNRYFCIISSSARVLRRCFVTSDSDGLRALLMLALGRCNKLKDYINSHYRFTMLVYYQNSHHNNNGAISPSAEKLNLC